MTERKKRKLIDSQTIAFMNLVENFSRTCSDMAEVCDKASFYMREPLKGIIEDFVIDIRLYGDTSQAFGRIYVRLKGCKLLEIFKSFEICQKHEGDFARIVKDAKLSVREFDKSMTIRRAIISSARGDLAALLGAGVIVVIMLDDFLGSSVWEILSSSYIGIGIMLYCIVCITVIAVTIIRGE